MKLSVYTFHRGISPDRFDAHNTQELIKVLQSTYEVEWHDFNGGDGFIYHGVQITHGSIVIVEFKDSGKFRVYDFGDNPNLTVKLSNSPLFDGAAIGQYNATLWNEVVQDTPLRGRVKAGPYPESYWELGLNNYNTFQEYRQQALLDSKLYWRGSLYSNNVPVEYLGVRKAVELLPDILTAAELHFGNYPIPFEDYLQEAVNYKLALSIGGGGGYICGDFCLRDIEMYGLGIPTIRPIYAITPVQPLIPNEHYIAVEAEFDNQFRYKNPELLAQKIAQRYREVINDTEYLDQVGTNARKWYIDNISSPTITNSILTALDL
jgi:hypothetical protein